MFSCTLCSLHMCDGLQDRYSRGMVSSLSKVLPSFFGGWVLADAQSGVDPLIFIVLLSFKTLIFSFFFLFNYPVTNSDLFFVFFSPEAMLFEASYLQSRIFKLLSYNQCCSLLTQFLRYFHKQENSTLPAVISE